MPSEKTKSRYLNLWIAAAVFAVVALVWMAGLIPQIDREVIENWVMLAGPWGPVLIIGLMTASIVASPIPSAPIALVSGAAYGHINGAIYVAIGSELGALLAFTIARYLGRDLVEQWLGNKISKGLLGSQNMLMLTVFGSRLLPFISFDAMSYAAGLSRLHLWRFLIATLAGILPASFVLAHFGAEAMEAGPNGGIWIVFGLGLLTAVPVVAATLWFKPAKANP